MRKKEISNLGKVLIREAQDGTGCSIQHNGCPCNQCFHTWVEDEIGLNNALGHMLWLIVLALRGDYTQEEIMESNKENFKEWADTKWIKKI